MVTVAEVRVRRLVAAFCEWTENGQVLLEQI